jgi:peptidoglycan-associated lipoprotein
MGSLKRASSFTFALLAIAASAGCSTSSTTTGSQPPSMRGAAALEAAPPRCETLQFPIYFQTGSNALTEPAKQMIQTSAGQAKRCRVSQVRVLGLADADGSAARNLELSKQRADVVAAALTAAGFPAPAFDVEAAGADGATSARGVADPVRRRTEVVVTFVQ